MERYQRAATTALEATAVARSMLGVGEISAGRGAFTYDQWALTGDEMSLGRIVSSGIDVHLHIQRPPDLIVLLVREGALTMQSGTASATLGPEEMGLIPPVDETRLRWSSVRFDLYSLTSSSLLRLLVDAEELHQVSAPRLTPSTVELGRYWRSAAQMIVGQVLTNTALKGRELVRTTAVDVYTAATIEAFDLTAEVHTADVRAAEIMQHVEAYLQDRLGDPIAVADIARAVNMSARTLQVLYERAGLGTPTEHLRRMRLEAARQLLQSGSGTMTVTRVARHFGYTNIGRFAAHYRTAYGESPLATLQRGRGELDESARKVIAADH